jgi:ABC-2 type transport system ATP-binding protein
VGDVVSADSDDIDGMNTAIDVTGLTKRFGEITAVQDLTFSVRRGAVTGFLGPNGAGKTTTLKMVLGLAAPSGGSAEVLGRPYSQLDEPARRIGAVLESTGFHPGRRGRDHLRILAAALELPDARVDAVLDEVGLTGAGKRRVKGYSLGMRQRLGLASALLGEPEVLILDEPANGLDPEGVQWLRRFLRGFAARGGTVLVSSHQLAEMAQTVDDVVIIAGGRLVLQSPLADLAREDGVRVRTPHPGRLISALAADGISADALDAETLVAFGTTSEAVGLAAAAAEAVIYEMSAERFDLEELFLDLTSQGVKS